MICCCFAFQEVERGWILLEVYVWGGRERCRLASLKRRVLSHNQYWCQERLPEKSQSSHEVGLKHGFCYKDCLSIRSGILLDVQRETSYLSISVHDNEIKIKSPKWNVQFTGFNGAGHVFGPAVLLQEIHAANMMCYRVHSCCFYSCFFNFSKELITPEIQSVYLEILYLLRTQHQQQDYATGSLPLLSSPAADDSGWF